MNEEWVEVVWGGETFTPVSYQTFKVGPLTMRTKVKPNETPEQAVMRAWTALDKAARVIYTNEKTAFLARIGIVAQEARETAKANRDTKG